MGTLISESPGRFGSVTAAAARSLWLVLALFWTAFATLEGVHHGAPAWGAVVAGLVVPDLAMLIGARSAAALERGRLAPAAVPYDNLTHRMTIPLVITVLYTVSPWEVPALFAALCGWMAHIAWERSLGYAMRHREGWQRG